MNNYQRRKLKQQQMLGQAFADPTSVRDKEDKGEYVAVSRAAEAVGLPVQLIHGWVRKHKVKSKRADNNRCVVKLEDVRKLAVRVKALRVEHELRPEGTNGEVCLDTRIHAGVQMAHFRHPGKSIEERSWEITKVDEFFVYGLDTQSKVLLFSHEKLAEHMANGNMRIEEVTHAQVGVGAPGQPHGKSNGARWVARKGR